MLRWLVRASVAGSANSDVRSESDRASRKASDAKTKEANDILDKIDLLKKNKSNQ